MEPIYELFYELILKPYLDDHYFASKEDEEKKIFTDFRGNKIYVSDDGYIEIIENVNSNKK